MAKAKPTRDGDVLIDRDTGGIFLVRGRHGVMRELGYVDDDRRIDEYEGCLERLRDGEHETLLSKGRSNEPRTESGVRATAEMRALRDACIEAANDPTNKVDALRQQIDRATEVLNAKAKA